MDSRSRSGTLDVPGTANPISQGADLLATMALSGMVAGSDGTFICGTITGAINAPVMSDLAGSTFTMQLIGATVPTPLLSCAKDHANYH